MEHFERLSVTSAEFCTELLLSEYNTHGLQANLGPQNVKNRARPV